MNANHMIKEMLQIIMGLVIVYVLAVVGMNSVIGFPIELPFL